MITIYDKVSQRKMRFLLPDDSNRVPLPYYVMLCVLFGGGFQSLYSKELQVETN